MNRISKELLKIAMSIMTYEQTKTYTEIANQYIEDDILNINDNSTQDQVYQLIYNELIRNWQNEIQNYIQSLSQKYDIVRQFQLGFAINHVLFHCTFDCNVNWSQKKNYFDCDVKLKIEDSYDNTKTIYCNSFAQFKAKIENWLILFINNNIFGSYQITSYNSNIINCQIYLGSQYHLNKLKKQISVDYDGIRSCKIIRTTKSKQSDAIIYTVKLQINIQNRKNHLVGQYYSTQDMIDICFSSISQMFGKLKLQKINF